MLRLEPASHLEKYNSNTSLSHFWQEQLLYTLRRREAHSVREVEAESCHGSSFHKVDSVTEVYSQTTGGECSCQTSSRKYQQNWYW